MKCQKCNNKNASVLIRQTIDGVDREYRICDECAKDLGFVSNFGFNPDLYLGGGFFIPGSFPKSSSFGSKGDLPNINSDASSRENKHCSNCKITLDEIRRDGRLGCGRCYEAFEEQIVHTFRRIQSGEKHRGRKTAQPAEKHETRVLRKEIEELREKIKEAVKIEEYEKAADYKSRITSKEKEIEKLGKQQESGEEGCGK